MTQRIVNLGIPDKGNGDPLRTAFSKINDNFTELYNYLGVANLTELAQDYAAEMFVNGDHQGITVEYNDINNKLNIQTTFDGDYNNLTNLPSIPTDISDLTDSQGYLSGLSDNIDGGSAITIYGFNDFMIDGNGASVIYGVDEKAFDGGGA
jgi:hypothetical protein